MTISHLLRPMLFTAFSVSALLCGWIGVLATVSLHSNAAPALVVLLPGETFLDRLPPGIAIVSRNSLSITLAAPQEDLAKTLYASGALLVLPSGLQGCAPSRVSLDQSPLLDIDRDS